MRSLPRVCPVWAEDGTTLSATTRDIVEVAHHASALHKLGIIRTDGSNLLGADAGVAAGLPCLGRKQDYTECNDSRCSRSGSSCEPGQQAGYKPVERIDFVGVNATAIACDHPRPRRRSIWRGYERSRGVRQDMKSIRYERGRSLRKIHGEELIYMRTVRGRGLRRLTGVFTTRILWHMASKLTRGKEVIEAPGDSAITGRLLMDRTCAGSGCFKSSERLGLRDIVVDMTLVL
jgi:hypothetical protein